MLAPPVVLVVVFLPYHRPHVVKSDALTELDDFRPDRNDFIAAVIDRTGELIPDIDTEPAAVIEHPVTFIPDKIQLVDIAFVAVIEAYLVICAVILQLPVRRRGDDEMNGPVGQFAHFSAVAADNRMVCCRVHVICDFAFSVCLFQSSSPLLCPIKQSRKPIAIASIIEDHYGKGMYTVWASLSLSSSSLCLICPLLCD